MPHGNIAMYPSIILENIRCFSGPHEFPIAPLTFLVGENSTGKSTLLGVAKFVASAMQSPQSVSFNTPPFQFGNFKDIVSSSGRESSPTTFTIGYSLPALTPDGRRLHDSLSGNVRISFIFSSDDAQPRLTEWRLDCDNYGIHATTRTSDRRPGQKIFQFYVKTPHSQTEHAFDIDFYVDSLYFLRDWGFLRHLLSRDRANLLSYQSPDHRLTDEDLDCLEAMAEIVHQVTVLGSPVACAPIRTKPKRTYDAVEDSHSPEGDHIPLLLARLSRNAKNRRWTMLREALTRFGKSSGMFTDIAIKRFAHDDPSVPFQLRIRGQGINDHAVLDVGYGVSQVLPIVVESFQNNQSVLLLQQPEVHLHPRAQAALGSYLLSLASRRKQVPMIVETHSDYLLDRVRADIRDRVCEFSHKDVLVLYFERIGDSINVAPIQLDSSGNLLNAPKGYRSFFMNEERRILGM